MQKDEAIAEIKRAGVRQEPHEALAYCDFSEVSPEAMKAMGYVPGENLFLVVKQDYRGSAWAGREVDIDPESLEPMRNSPFLRAGGDVAALEWAISGKAEQAFLEASGVPFSGRSAARKTSRSNEGIG